MAHDPLSCTVIMRARNDMPIIHRTLAALGRQRPHTFEFLAFDNGSTDGTREALVNAKATVHDVPQGQYNPGRVLNQGVRLAKGNIVVFLNSDTVPETDDFVFRLISPIQKGQADVTYGRQTPRADATPLVKRDYTWAFGDNPPPGLFFSLAASAFVRDVLVSHPFSEEIQYSEDLAWAKAGLARGVRIEYAKDARAEHSHNYTVRETWKRFFEEGRADAVIFDDGSKPIQPLRATLGIGVDVARDVPVCWAAHDMATLVRAPVVRAAQRLGYMTGRIIGPRRRLGA